MKTNLQKLSTSSEVAKLQEKPISKAVREALESFSTRELGLLENPLKEYSREALSILEMKDLTSKEITEIQLGNLLGVSRAKTMEMIKKDRESDQVKAMLEQVGLSQTAENDEKFAIAA